MKEIYAHIISFDWQSAVFAYDLGMPGFVELDILNTGKTIKSVEATGNGRLYLDELPAETQICLRLRYPEGEQQLFFTTLPAPQGELINQFALIADPHISIKQENRKGRFFVESAAIGEDVVKRCAELGIKYTLWPGDITNEGYPEEYAIAAEVLKKLPQEPWLIPGNHDYGPELWQKSFGVRRWERKLPGIGKVIGIDTGDKLLHKNDAEAIQKELEISGRVTIMTHYQLFESPDINHVAAAAVIPSNIGDYAELMEKISNTPSVIYAGHQNIMSVTHIGKAIQINLPQPPQYPCGWIRVRCFENGTYYTFEPISSEVLRQWSRRAGEEAADFYGERQWRAAYRRGRFPESCNFFLRSVK